MNKHKFVLASFLLFIFFISSCNQLKSKYYIGEKETIPMKELKSETIWQFGDDVFYLRILDSLNVIASSLEWQESDKEYKVKTFEVIFTNLDEAKFLNVKGEDGMYTLLRMVGADDGTIVFFTVNEEFMKNEIKQGQVRAKEDGSDYILDISKQELDNYVAKNINDLFSIKTPGIIKPLVNITKENK